MYNYTPLILFIMERFDKRGYMQSIQCNVGKLRCLSKLLRSLWQSQTDLYSSGLNHQLLQMCIKINIITWIINCALFGHVQLADLLMRFDKRWYMQSIQCNVGKLQCLSKLLRTLQQSQTNQYSSSLNHQHLQMCIKIIIVIKWIIHCALFGHVQLADLLMGSTIQRNGSVVYMM